MQEIIQNLLKPQSRYNPNSIMFSVEFFTKTSLKNEDF